MRNPKVWIAIIAIVAVGILVKIFLPFSTGAVQASVAIAPETIFFIGGFPISNTLLTTWIVMILIVVVFLLATRNMSLIPSSFQNAIEMLVEAIMGLAESVAGPSRWRKFFTIAASIFILLFFSNLIALIPGFGPIGVIKIEEGHEAPQGIVLLGDAPSFFHAEAEGEVPILAPFVRAPATDINLALALALVSVVMTQIYGMQAQGALKYWTRFFSFGRLLKGDIMMGLIDVFVGIVELVSEIAKILAFTFRLFGNIFAGEVVLLIMSFLFLALPFIFYGLELFVAVVQAFVFAVLTLAFMTIATSEHGAEAQHH